MSAAAKPSALLFLGGLLAVYLASDLLVFHGPAHHSLQPLLSGKKEEIAAKVDDTIITRAQLDRAVASALWLKGTSPSEATPEALASARSEALDGLIEHELLRSRIIAAENPPIPTTAEIDGRIQKLAERFDSKAAMLAAMKSQGISSETDLRDRLAAQIQQEKFIVAEIAPKVRVTDDEARKWFSENSKDLANPERVEARHVFIATLEHPPEEAKQKLEEALVALTEKKKDFATLARELSDDPANKESGGSLGWMTRDRLPVDFGAPLFSLEIGKPTLIRSRLGWHLAEVTARKPAEPRSFEQARPEVIAALEAIKRRAALEEYRKALRQSASGKIVVF